MLDTLRSEKGSLDDSPPPYQQRSDRGSKAPFNETAWDDDSNIGDRKSTGEASDYFDDDEGAGSSADVLGAPVKTHKFVTTSVWSQKGHEIQLADGTNVFWVRNKRALFKSPQINLHVDSGHGDIVAACRLNAWRRKLLFNLGNPDCTDKDAWSVSECGSWTGKLYSFDVDGQTYRWKRTHRKDLLLPGASRLGQKHFKLVDRQDRVLAAFVFTQSMFGKMKQIGTLSWYVQLTHNEELSALAVLLGIRETIKQQEQSAACS